jgi:3-methyl-2-oxobutanoate hydroxymethyltransferase
MSLTTPRSAEPDSRAPKVTVQTLRESKRLGRRLATMTAYDFPTARIVDQAGIDLVLVGDSLGMAVLGHEDTLSVTLDDMIHHARAVRRGTSSAFMVVDMPFGSFHVSDEDTVRNALRIVKESGAEAVKIEGARLSRIRAVLAAEIPVVGHLGLTPQSVHAMGGYKVQGRTHAAVEQLVEDALALEQAGVCALVLEGIPREVAARITAGLEIPTIGIGAGPDCDGQILVFHDMFQLTFAPAAKFVRRFGDAATLFREGIEAYRQAVAGGTFPADTESYHLPAEMRPQPNTVELDDETRKRAAKAQALAAAGAR